MFTQQWSTSERKYDVIVERDVKVAMPDGTLLDGDIYRPASDERFPVILGAHAYNKNLQSPPMRPVGFTPMRGYMESGDSTFFARRGYVHAVFNVRGSGSSEGFYQLMGPLEVRDVCELIDWLAAQPWSSGAVGMFGVSYFARLAKAVAALGPTPLKAIFSPFAGTDDYRHRCYHGGILAHGFISHWRNSLHRPNYRSLYKETHGESRLQRSHRPSFARRRNHGAAGAARSAAKSRRRHQRIDCRFPTCIRSTARSGVSTARRMKKRRFPLTSALAGAITVCISPARFRRGKIGAVRRRWSSVRGFISTARCISIKTSRCAGSTTGSKASITASWMSRRSAASCRPPANGKILMTGPHPKRAGQHSICTRMAFSASTSFGPPKASDSFDESNFEHGAVTYATPPLVENTEVLGPSVLTLYLSVTDTDALLFATLLLIDREDKEHELTRGWLRASQRKLRADSTPWEPIQAHEKREPLEAGENLRAKQFPSCRRRVCFKPASASPSASKAPTTSRR